MPNTFQDALDQIKALHRDGIKPGVHVCPPPFNDTPLLLVNLAIDSEDLSVHAILFDPESGGQISCEALKLLARKKGIPEDEHARVTTSLKASLPYFNGQKNPAAFENQAVADPEMISGQVLSHFKGGTYTAFSVLGPESKSARVVYIAHKDGLWWIRPWAEFEQTRFQASKESPLNLGEAGLDFLV